MPPEFLAYMKRREIATKLGQNLKVVSAIVEIVNNSRDLISLALVCRTFLPLALKQLWSKPKLSTHLKLERLQSTLSSPDQILPYRTFINAFYLSNFPDISDDAFKTLGGCENLTYLEIPRCQNINNSTIHTMLGHCHSLTVVDFEELRSISDEAIINLARNNPGLQGAKLSGCTFLSDRALLFLGNYCSNLREVFLQNIPKITAFGLRYLLVRCPRIQTLDISHCKFVDDEILRLIWGTLPTLRKLLVAGCDKITDQGFVSTGSVLIGPQHTTPNLGLANDAGSSGNLNHPAIPNPAALNLKHLDLTDCEKLTDLAIRTITSNSPKLHVLVLKNCPLLTDISIQAITRLGKNINTLGLAKLPSITDDSIEELSKYCRRLKGVDLSECVKLTDRSVLALSSLSRLESLRFNSIDNITDDGIRALADRQRATLKRLHLSYCKAVTGEAIDYLLTKQPQVDFISLSGVPSFLDDPALEVLSKQAGKGYSQKTYRVYSSPNTTAQLRQHLSQRQNSGDDDSAAGLDPQPLTQGPTSQIVGSTPPTAAAPVQVSNGTLPIETSAASSSPQVNPPRPEVEPAKPRSSSSNNTTIANANPELAGTKGAGATLELDLLIPSTQSTITPDPVRLSGSISSFEDLEDTTYDILQDSDFESDHEDGSDGEQELMKKEELTTNSIRHSTSVDRGGPLGLDEENDDDDEDGFEILSDNERVDDADIRRKAA